MKNKWNVLPLIVLMLAMISLPSILSQQPLPKTVEELQQLPPKQRNELQQKKVRFNQLSEEKKSGYREFNAKLNAAPNQQRLRKVMIAYNKWLLDLDDGLRERILAMPLEQRLQEVVQLVSQEQEQRFKELLDTNLKHDDLVQVGRWYNGWLDRQTENLAELGKSIEDKVAQGIIKQTTDTRQRGTIILLSLLREQGDMKWHDWFEDWQSDVTNLMGTLSETSQLFYASAESDQQRLQLLLRWGYYSFVAQSMQGVSDDELLEFYKNEMSREDREVLDRQQPASMIPMLRRFYFQYRMPEVIKRLLAQTEQLSD